MRKSMQLDGDIWLTVDASQPRRLTCQQESTISNFECFLLSSLFFKLFLRQSILKSSEACAQHEPVQADMQPHSHAQCNALRG